MSGDGDRVYDPEKLVHDPRAEDRSGRTVGRSYIFDRQGVYVGESLVDLSEGGGVELGIRLKAQPGEDVEWTDFLSGYRVVENGENEDPAFDEQILGSVSREEVDSYRENRWVELEDDRYHVHVENIHSEAPGVLGIRGDRPAEEFLDAAAPYAAGLASVDLEGGEGFRDADPEELWRSVLRDSLRGASERRKEVLQRR